MTPRRPMNPGYMEHDYTTEWQVCDSCGLRIGTDITTQWDDVYYAVGHNQDKCPRCADGRMGLPKKIVPTDWIELRCSHCKRVGHSGPVYQCLKCKKFACQCGPCTYLYPAPFYGGWLTDSRGNALLYRCDGRRVPVTKLGEVITSLFGG